MSVAVCHPERRRWARGLCKPCYSRRQEAGEFRRVKIVPTCHPDHPHHALGLCRPCYKNRPELKRRALLKTYDMTPAEYDALVEEQGGVCAICGKPPSDGRLRVDHDHRTNRRRGLLCNACNRGLGLLGDDPEVVGAAARYLRGHSA